MERGSTVIVVVGYLARDEIPADVAAAGLVHRLSLALLSDRHPDTGLDRGLYAALVERVRQVVGADRLSARIEPGTAASISRAVAGPDGDVELFLGEILEAFDDVPPDRVELYRGDALVAVAGHEAYWKVGGPAPYHDRYVVPVFTGEDLSEVLIAAAREVCGRCGAELTALHRGDAAPPVPSRWETIGAALRRLWS